MTGTWSINSDETVDQINRDSSSRGPRVNVGDMMWETGNANQARYLGFFPIHNTFEISLVVAGDVPIEYIMNSHATAIL